MVEPQAALTPHLLLVRVQASLLPVLTLTRILHLAASPPPTPVSQEEHPFPLQTTV